MRKGRWGGERTKGEKHVTKQGTVISACLRPAVKLKFKKFLTYVEESQHGYGLHCLAQPHLVCQNDICVADPAAQKHQGE